MIYNCQYLGGARNQNRASAVVRSADSALLAVLAARPGLLSLTGQEARRPEPPERRARSVDSTVAGAPPRICSDCMISKFVF